MKRIVALIASALLLSLPGCAGGAKTGPTGAGAGAEARAPAPALAAQPWAAVTPVPWVPDPLTGQTAPAPVHDKACALSRGSPALSAALLSADWRPHPLNPAGLWVPAVALIVCNASENPEPQPRIKLVVTSERGHAATTWISLPKLEPGEAIGPILAFSYQGVPSAQGALWQQDGTRWPAWSVNLTTGAGGTLAEAKVSRRLGGPGATSSEAPGGASLPAHLPLDLMKQLAYSQASFTTGGKDQVSVFLHAPDAAYSVVDAPWCGAPVGTVTVQASQWGLYVSSGVALPERFADLGELDFPGGRGLKAVPVPKAGITFLMLEQYGSCAVPNWHLIYAYDHATGELYRPNIRLESGLVRAATVSRYDLGEDGTLVDHYYSNAGDVGNHTITYHWDATARMWLFLTHART
jgi:hypothetical protein